MPNVLAGLFTVLAKHARNLKLAKKVVKSYINIPLEALEYRIILWLLL